MKRIVVLGLLAFSSLAFAFVQDAVHAVHGTISRIDSATKTIVVKTADGTEHTLHFIGRTTVHGSESAAKDAFHGLKEGSEVVAHYTAKGSAETALEVDRVGKDGMKAMDGTVKQVDRGGKKLVVDSADGTEETFRLTDHATVDAAKGVDKATQKSTKVTVYYTEDSGKKIAHFFETH